MPVVRAGGVLPPFGLYHRLALGALCVCLAAGAAQRAARDLAATPGVYRCAVPECEEAGREVYHAGWVSDVLIEQGGCTRPAPATRGPAASVTTPETLDVLCPPELFNFSVMVPCEQYVYLQQDSFYGEVSGRSGPSYVEEHLHTCSPAPKDSSLPIFFRCK